MKISVIGTGYVGLTTGTCLAEIGHNVICVDVDEKKVKNLQNGIIPIYEPGLEELVQRNLKEGRLVFSTDSKYAIESSEVVFSAVGTPPGENYNADLTFVKEVAKSFGAFTNNYKVFVNKSTVPVGTADICSEIISKGMSKRGVSFGFGIISNPEFLKEGTAVQDTLYPDRIVIGFSSEQARKTMEKVYAPLVNMSGADVLYTDIRSAEIIKYASNSFLATKIAFINEIANFCDLVGGDVKIIAKGMGLDKRIGPDFLNAGIGYGGGCFPKDVAALIQTGKQYGYDFGILESVESANERQKSVLFKKLLSKVPNLKGKKIAVWGLAFKANTDDMRESPSIPVISALLSNGANVVAHDFAAEEISKGYFTEIELADEPFDAATGADALLILTEWKEYKDIDFKELKNVMKGNILIDGRNLLDKDYLLALGFDYTAIGR